MDRRGVAMKKLLLVFALTLSLAAVACGADRGSAVSETPPQTEPAASAPGPAATAEPAQSLEGRFSHGEMGAYLDAIAPMVAQFFAEQYPRLPDANLVYIPSGRAARTACGVSDSAAYEYCGANQTIYVGQDLLWAFYRQAGDAAPALALAHEWGHHVQVMLGVPFARTAAQSVNFENQADCFAGAWARYADEQGWLETEDDLQDINALMRLIGSSETSRRDHGTVAERTAAFESAYEGGLKACNAYYPDDPVA
jgi:predicted metalloprotease